MSTHLNETSVNEDTRTERIQNTADDACGGASGVVSRPDTETGSDTDGGRDTVEKGTDDWDVRILSGKVHVC